MIPSVYQLLPIAFSGARLILSMWTSFGGGLVFGALLEMLDLRVFVTRDGMQVITFTEASVNSGIPGNVPANINTIFLKTGGALSYSNTSQSVHLLSTPFIHPYHHFRRLLLSSPS